jgi:hypothetical protein
MRHPSLLLVALLCGILSLNSPAQIDFSPLHSSGFGKRGSEYNVPPPPSGNNNNPSEASPEDAAAQQRRQDAQDLNKQGIQFWNNGQWKLATNAFNAALEKWPDNETIRQNLKIASDKVAEKEAQKKRDQQAEFEKNKNEILSSMKGIGTDSEFGGLKGISPGENTGLKDIADSGFGGLKPLPVANTDPMVVDARNVPTGLPKFVEDSIPHTPAGDRVRKGLEAIQTHDWKVARAWFQDALNRQPGDPGLLRLVDLAQYTLQRESQTTDGKLAGQNDEEIINALEGYNQNFLSKHPSMSDGEFFKQEDPAWIQFFRYITSKLPKKPPVEAPPAANGVRS